MQRERHLRVLETIDEGIAAAEQITIEDGIRAAVEAGRIGVAEAAEILAVFEKREGAVVELRPDLPPTVA